jgi:CubicO group peptidase (beta-lactamase class C family)
MTKALSGLAFLGFLAACAAAPPPLPAVAPASMAAPLRTAVDAQVAAGFAGVVLVGRGDDLILFEAYGQAGGAPIDRDRPFWIASAGKQFVAAAIMKLVDRGWLRLDDPISLHIPQVPADKAGITIRQLLSHNSGIGQSYVSESQPDRESALRAMLAEPLAGAPGSGFRYANSNIQFAAAIVEIVSGLSYREFAARNLWEPAGVAATGLAGDAGAAAVVPIAGELPPRLRQAYWGEQGVYASAGDVWRWYRVLQAGRILRPERVQAMFAPATRTGEGQATLGWFTGTSPGGRQTIYIRGNEGFGANALIYAYPDSDIVIVVLSHAGDAPDGTSWSRTMHGEIEAVLGL